MTTLIAETDPTPVDEPAATRTAGRTSGPAGGEGSRRVTPRGRRLWLLVGIWVAVVLGSLALTVYLLEPLFQSRQQSELLESYRSDIFKASNESRGLVRVSKSTTAPELGAPVAIVEIGDLQLQQVAIEGSTSSHTQTGPGHVSGTAAPGQPGNAVLVGRRLGFGAPFDRLAELEPGASILITTTQGQVVYVVDSVRQADVVEPSADMPTSSAATGGGIQRDNSGADVVTVDDLYGPSEDDRLTLVTSASALPWNASRATVVVAKLDGKPFEPTPQGGRTDSTTGLSGESSAWAPVVLVLLAFGATAVAAVYLYRRWSFRAAYLLTTPPLIVFTILLAESVTRLLPSWL